MVFRTKRPRGWRVRQTISRGELISSHPLDRRPLYQIQTDSYFKALLPGKRMARWRPKDVQQGLIPKHMVGQYKYFEIGTGPQRSTQYIKVDKKLRKYVGKKRLPNPSWEGTRYHPGKKKFFTDHTKWSKIKEEALRRSHDLANLNEQGKREFRNTGSYSPENVVGAKELKGFTIKGLNSIMRDKGYEPSIYYERRPNRSDRYPTAVGL